MNLFRRIICRLLFCSLVVHSQCDPCLAEDENQSQLGQRFQEQILPLLQEHCLTCHDQDQPEADLDLSQFGKLADVHRAQLTWEIILERVAASEMPPRDAQPLSAQQREEFVDWIRDARAHEAQRNAGDPGDVLARRLSNAEFDNCIRDLTGVDLRPTRTFPVDPANAAGFDNTGESLTMSPALLKKYLDAARTVAEHMVLTPRGIEFSPHPVMTDTDRDKYCVKRIVEFYQQQPTNLADYFVAAWSFQNRDSPELTLDKIARAHDVSPKYLRTIVSTLELQYDLGPLAQLRSLWQELKAIPLGHATTDQVSILCQQMSDYVYAVRKEFETYFGNLEIEGVHAGSQPLVLWKNKQYAAHRLTADFARLETPFIDATQDKSQKPHIPANSISMQMWKSLADDTQRERFKAECRVFCSVFPDAFFISERGRDYLNKPRDEQEKGRLLSAGFHSMMGYFRDDQPLVDLILDEPGRSELDALWQELDFFTAAPLRQYQGFLWFERTDSRFMRDAQFDFARPEDKAALTEPLIQKLSQVYLEKATANGGSTVALAAIADYFKEINQHIRWVENSRQTAEPLQLEALLAFAERAHRRPMSAQAKEELRQFYRSRRDDDGLDHPAALQDLLVALLMSPQFCYRTDLLRDTAELRALDDYELASRLSFFIWSSLPDAELMACAAAGELRKPAVLKHQTLRMLADSRVRGLATEFAANWLDFRRFEEHNSVDRQRFTTFDDDLRAAMFEEPIRFFMDVAQRNTSVLDLIYGKHTFVNQVLASHYGIDGLHWSDAEWQRVSNADQFGRGGLLPMAVFLTKNAPGLRTSPVKRGYWVVKRLLGERIPPPPPNVPELPNDETQLELPLREALARHREHESCAGCHDRIDAYGLVFEGYGPIGERRTVDLAGRSVDTTATFPDGKQCNSLAELIDFIRRDREADFLSNFNRKLLSYALNRGLQLSDDSLLEAMKVGSLDGQPLFHELVEKIVTSPQFLNKRGRDTASDNRPLETAP